MAGCLNGNVDANAGFGTKSTAIALPCGISIKLPIPDISIILPTLLLSFSFPPKFPFSFSLNCDPTDPIDISAGLPYGGGRVACFDPNPDDSDDF